MGIQFRYPVPVLSCEASILRFIPLVMLFCRCINYALCINYARCVNLCIFFWWGWGTARLVVGGLGPHLCALSHCFPASTAFYPVSMVSPLKADVFARELSNHPDQTKVSFVLNGLRYGFKLGCPLGK